MIREKTTDREQFSYEEKLRIAQKSDEKCCHCGKKVYFDYKATVEHYIPISKGGTNEDANLVMLCEECNKQKENRIIPPRFYLSHLKPEHMEKLEQHFDDYIHSFEYVNRRNLLACDQYMIEIIPRAGYKAYKKMPKQKISKIPTQKFWLKKCLQNDLPKVREYFIQYLKKNATHDVETPIANDIINFWLQFGCIYYIENANEIKTMIAITICDLKGKTPENIEKTINLFACPYYHNANIIALTREILDDIPRIITKEQKLVCIPVVTTMLKADKTALYTVTDNGRYHAISANDHLIRSQVFYSKKDKLEEKDKENTIKFFANFAEIEQKAKQWRIEHNHGNIEWMIS